MSNTLKLDVKAWGFGAFVRKTTKATGCLLEGGRVEVNVTDDGDDDDDDDDDAFEQDWCM